MMRCMFIGPFYDVLIDSHWSHNDTVSTVSRRIQSPSTYCARPKRISRDYPTLPWKDSTFVDPLFITCFQGVLQYVVVVVVVAVAAVVTPEMIVATALSILDVLTEFKSVRKVTLIYHFMGCVLWYTALDISSG